MGSSPTAVLAPYSSISRVLNFISVPTSVILEGISSNGKTLPLQGRDRGSTLLISISSLGGACTKGAKIFCKDLVSGSIPVFSTFFKNINYASIVQ